MTRDKGEEEWLLGRFQWVAFAFRLGAEVLTRGFGQSCKTPQFGPAMIALSS